MYRIGDSFCALIIISIIANQYCKNFKHILDISWAVVSKTRLSYYNFTTRWVDLVGLFWLKQNLVETSWGAMVFSLIKFVFKNWFISVIIGLCMYQPIHCWEVMTGGVILFLRNSFFISFLSCVPSFNFLLCLQLVKKFVVVVWWWWWCGGVVVA